MQAFIQDNPFRENGYLERLERTSDKAKRERLFHRNWEYDDDPNALCNFDDIDAVFENDHLIAKIQSEEYYLTCDVARLGSDKARIAVWKGFKVIHQILLALSRKRRNWSSRQDYRSWKGFKVIH